MRKALVDRIKYLSVGQKLLLVFVVLIVEISRPVYAQSRNVTIQTGYTTLKQVIDEIEKQTDYLFVYDNSEINTKMAIYIDVRNKTVDTILTIALKGTGITYSIQNRNIVLIKDLKADLSIHNQQKVTARGVVRNSHGEPLIGVAVQEKGTKHGVTTNIDGTFFIQVSTPKVVLMFSCIGYKNQESAIDRNRPMNVILQEDNQTLDEVVVIGYGTMKRSDLTGAISKVNSADLPHAGNMSLGQMMSGKVPGMQVSITSAQPGGGVWAQIRGNAAGGAGNSGPLYVVDGYPISTDVTEPWSGNRYNSGSKSPLNHLNPSDIESIEVLKDASATAIYGSRAANGVVLITTKRGKEGEKPRVQYSGAVSVQKKANQIKMLNGPDFMRETNRVLYEEWLSDNKIAPYGNTDPNSVSTYDGNKYTLEDIQNAKTTDWLGAIERDGFMTQHNVSLTGGTDKTYYYISGSYFGQQGVIKNNGIKRYSGRINFDQKLGKYIKMGVNLNVSQVNSDNVALGGASNENAGVIRAAMNANPTLSIRDEEWHYVLDPAQPFLANPVSLLEISDESKINELLGSFFLTLTPLKGLELKMNAGFQQEKGERNTYIPKTTLYGANAGGQAARAYVSRSSKLFDLTITYQTKIEKKHTLLGMFGYSYQDFAANGFDAGNSRFITDAFKWNSLASGEHTKPTVNSWGNQDKLVSVLARLNYNFDNRYLLSATIRGDASPKFAENHKWGYFPSVALAWRIINEKCMQNQSVFSDLKWRISLGQTGNSNIGNNSLSLYSTGYHYNFGDKTEIGVAQSQLANPNLKWETTTELNVGLDFGFFRNRVIGSMEYFKRRITDLLNIKELMQYYPISGVMSNIGTKGSQGFELGINTRNLLGEFQWSTDVVFSLYRDRWLERDPQWKKTIYEGEKDMLNPFYYYLSDGLVQASDMNPDGTCAIPHMPNAKPGMIKYKDLNGRDENGKLKVGPDGKLDDADIVYKGTRSPKFYLGFGNVFIYKCFDLNVFFYGYLGRKLENPAYDWYLKGSWNLPNGVNMAAAVKDRWTHDNPTGKYPTSMQNPYDRGSDFWLEKADFLRCKNVTLGYTLPKSKKTDQVIRNLRVYVDVQNPFVITTYSGIDPEMDGMAAYPTQLTVSFGIDITF